MALGSACSHFDNVLTITGHTHEKLTSIILFLTITNSSLLLVDALLKSDILVSGLLTMKIN